MAMAMSALEALKALKAAKQNQVQASPTSTHYYPLVALPVPEVIRIPKSLQVSVAWHTPPQIPTLLPRKLTTAEKLAALGLTKAEPTTVQVPTLPTLVPQAPITATPQGKLVSVSLPPIVVQNITNIHIKKLVVQQTVVNVTAGTVDQGRPAYDSEAPATHPIKEVYEVQDELPAPSLPALPALPALPTTAQLQKHEVTYDHLNTKQRLAVEYARKGLSFCLVGSAGSGKTTTQQLIVKMLAESGQIKALGHDTKTLKASSPSIVFVSFTNPAVANIKSAVPEEYKANCLTIHKFTEFQPVYYDRGDDSGRMTMRFEPTRTLLNPVKGITHVVGEESGTWSLDLADILFDAVDNPDCIWIFLGDLNQLPPAFGDGILGFKLLELPVVTLDEVYRTDKDSPIKKLALRILDGTPISDDEMDSLCKPGELEVYRYPRKLEVDDTNNALGQHFAKLVREGKFDPAEDVLIAPYNKLVGTIELGKWIAQAHAEINQQPVWEVVAGIRKEYYAVGDYVYFNKRKFCIESIALNDSYTGDLPELPSLTMNRWGIDRGSMTVELIERKKKQQKEHLEKLFSGDFSLDSGDGFHSDEEEAKVSKQASHCITLKGLEDDDSPPVTISQVGEVSSMYFAHALTVYKAMGSEWRNVYCVFHDCHSRQLVRETLYTAVTRARKFLKIYYHGDKTSSKRSAGTFYKGVLSQRIPGHTTEEKLQYFRDKLKLELLKIELTTGKKFPVVADHMESSDMRSLIKTMLQMKKLGADLGVDGSSGIGA